MGSPSVDVKFDFVPWDGTPGDPYDSFQIRLMNNASKCDDRGWSLADTLADVDEGGAMGGMCSGGSTRSPQCPIDL